MSLNNRPWNARERAILDLLADGLPRSADEIHRDTGGAYLSDTVVALRGLTYGVTRYDGPVWPLAADGGQLLLAEFVPTLYALANPDRCRMIDAKRAKVAALLDARKRAIQ